ncbi:hypothetical protein O1611_g10576 [Lasiodiplodia mahajangana]|uniref:Uncharacterized protein n=1 Tax=Lasiodiplodia mahajangana TaxID=1108764 RepID=A0ACC2IWN9_9PEZI|nr:hypothetical protein O1611_g10576 [Lasiodiplodia mahajangana]
MAYWSLDQLLGNAAYVYQVIWSPNAHYLAFIDEGFRSQNIAIFSVKKEAALYEPLLIDHYLTKAGCEPLTNTHFHPAEDIFMFVETRTVYLWNFSTTPPQPIKQFGHHRDKHSLDLDPAVSFSHCGTSIAITYPGRLWPELIPLPNLSIGDRKRKLPYETSPDHSPKERKKIIIVEDKGAQQAMSVMSRIQCPVITNSAIVLGDNTAGAVTTILGTATRATGSGSLCIYQSDNTETQTIQVVNLPKHIPANEVSATLTLPTKFDENTEDRNGFLTLAITQAPAITYASDEAPLSTHLPIVIRKDTRALRTGNMRPAAGRLNYRTDI